MRSVEFALILSATIFLASACSESVVTTNNSQPLGSPAPSLPAATPDELASARINFQKHCAGCHGERADGGLKEVDGKKFKVPSLREGHALEHTDEKFIVQISEGDDEMPAFKDKLNPEEIKELVRFIRKEFQGK
ncbi:MAG: c-type cytochrome [Pyrinomonadaceae bacterium]